jgi:hypothetical protein
MSNVMVNGKKAADCVARPTPLASIEDYEALSSVYTAVRRQRFWDRKGVLAARPIQARGHSGATWARKGRNEQPVYTVLA